MHIALINPLIPQNTGSVARLSAGTNTVLHLVGDLGFSLDDLQRRGRAGTVIMRALAADRPPGSSPTESRLERRFEEVVGQVFGERVVRRVPGGGAAGERPQDAAHLAETGVPEAAEVQQLLVALLPEGRDGPDPGVDQPASGAVRERQ